MIVKGLLNVIYSFLSFVFSAVNLPSFPDSFMDILNTVVSYLEMGVGVLGNYVDLEYLSTLFSIFISLYLALELWKLFYWLIRKIPMLGMK